MSARIRDQRFQAKLMAADAAATFISAGDTVATSGFTGSGHPKAVPLALAARIRQAHARGDAFRVRLMTGASTAPELDGALARVDGIELRLPYQSDPTVRECINTGRVDYLDIHLGHVGQQARSGFFGNIDTAVIEISAILEGGRLVPSSSVGNNKTWLDCADKVILEVNRWQPMELDGMHDIHHGSALPPGRAPIPLERVDDRIGEQWLRVDPDKVVAVVETDARDRNSAFLSPDECSKRIADHLLGFLGHEVDRGRLPPRLLPLQSGVGDIANAVIIGLAESGYSELEAWTEVIQDGMLRLLQDDVLRFASATAFSLSNAGIDALLGNIETLRKRILLRPQGISNHPELIRRLGCIAMNGMLEADIYGNVNSTHVAGTRIVNGIGGSGDFARNAFLSVFMAPSLAKGGKASTIVPMVSHVDHTEHDTMILITDQGLADLRGLSPKQRATVVIRNCAHPAYRDMLEDYFARALRDSVGKHTPHLLREALSWHARFVETGSMQVDPR